MIKKRLPEVGDKVRTVEKFKKGADYRGRKLAEALETENLGIIDAITETNGISQARIRIISGSLADLRSRGQYAYDYFWHMYPGNIEVIK